VIHAVQEYAETAVDVLARRTRLAFLNVRAAEESLPRVIQLMSRELGWSKQREQVNTGVIQVGVPRRQPHRRSGLATVPSVGAVP